MKAIINGKIVLKEKIICGKALLYDDKIQGFCNNDEIPEGTEIIDACGKLVAPGLIDLHIHGYLGEDTSDGKADGIRKMAYGIVKNGVTGWLPTTMTVSKTEIQNAFDTVRSLVDESKDWQGSTILGVNSEGPFINPKKKGAQAEQHILKPDAEFIKANADIVRIVTLAPEMDEGCKAIKEICRDTDVVVSMGHTDATYEQACEGILNGVSHTTHLFNAMSPLAHRNPGVVGAAFNNDVTAELIADKFHVNKNLFKTIAKLKGERLCLITDCVRAGGLEDGDYTLGGQKIILKGIECRLEDGTIAGSVLTLNKAVYNFYTEADTPLWYAIACASLHPAKVLGLEDCKGSLETGKDADIIITDENMKIYKTIIGGTVRYEA